jgi:hypothetical protein
MSTTPNAKEITFYAVGMWKGLSEAEWTKDDLIDLGKSLFSKRTLKSLIEGGKRDKEIFAMINRNFGRAAMIMINYVEEQKTKAEAAKAEAKPETAEIKAEPKAEAAP